MLVKVNSDIEKKLDRISKRSNIKKDVMLEKILLGFISRYEAKHGDIKLIEGKKKRTDIWTMYQIYKEIYFRLYGIEYKPASKEKEKQDFKNIKDIQKKIIDMVITKEGVNVISVSEPDLINAFRFLLEKMPDWWKKNAFNLHSINSKFDKILHSIEHGKQRGKTAPDDFISSLSGNEHS